MLVAVATPEATTPAPTSADLALTDASAALLVATSKAAAERKDLAAASRAVRSAEAALEACAGQSDRNFALLVMDRDRANSQLEVCGDRVERSAKAVTAAEAAVAEAKIAVARQTVAALDAEIQTGNLSILNELAAIGRSMVDRVHRLKSLASDANQLEATLPGYQPNWDGSPSHRQSALVAAPAPYVNTSASTILQVAARYVAELDLLATNQKKGS